MMLFLSREHQPEWPHMQIQEEAVVTHIQTFFIATDHYTTDIFYCHHDSIRYSLYSHTNIYLQDCSGQSVIGKLLHATQRCIHEQKIGVKVPTLRLVHSQYGVIACFYKKTQNMQLFSKT